jgi:hypothetical protein
MIRISEQDKKIKYHVNSEGYLFVYSLGKDSSLSKATVTDYEPESYQQMFASLPTTNSVVNINYINQTFKVESKKLRVFTKLFGTLN